MKRLFLISGFIVCLSLFALSQRFNGGLILGGNVSQVDGDNNGGYHKFGFSGGAFVSLKVSPHSSFQLEMEYIQKGSRGQDSVLRTDFLMRFHYLEVPFLYQYTFAKRFSLEAGPAMDVLLGSRFESNGLEGPDADPYPMRTVTLAGIFGASYDISKHLKVNYRINYSLLSIRHKPDEKGVPSYYRYIFWQYGQFNNVMSLSLIWYFKEKDFGL